MKAQKLLIFAVFALTILSLSLVAAVSLAEWELTTDGVAINVDSNVDTGAFTSSGVTDNPFGTNGANAEDWELTGTLGTSKYFEVTIAPKTDYALTITDINFDYSASIVGPASFELQYSKQSGFGSPTILVTKDDVSTTEESSSNSGLNVQLSSGETLTLRWFGYNFNTGTNEFRVKNLNVEGTVTPSTSSENFCKEGPKDTSDLTLNVDIKNRGEGPEDDEWLPLDRIEVEVELENDKNVDLDDVIFELGLFKQGSNKNIADDMIWISADAEEIEVGDIDEDEQDKHTFEFKVDPEIEDGTYWLMVKAYPDKGSTREEDICIDFSDDLPETSYQIIKIDKEDNDERLVIVDTDAMDVVEAFCGESVIVSADIYNIGEDDQDQVKIKLEIKELGILIEREIREDLDSGDKQRVEFIFDIPSNAQEKTYMMEFRTFYDYDDKDDEYDEFSERFTSHLKARGECGIALEPTITAILASEAKVGEELVVQISITNLDEATDFIIALSGYESWAELIELDPSIVHIGESETKQATAKFVPYEVGSQTFTIQAIYAGKTTEQQVTVSINEGVSSGILTGAFSGLGNTGLYVLAIVLLVLIILIIILIVKVAGSAKPAEF